MFRSPHAAKSALCMSRSVGFIALPLLVPGRPIAVASPVREFIWPIGAAARAHKPRGERLLYDPTAALSDGWWADNRTVEGASPAKL